MRCHRVRVKGGGLVMSKPDTDAILDVVQFGTPCTTYVVNSKNVYA